ncbi:hypothetical protein [Ralstonia sp. UBA689]|uniref:hypothetical protein n=1 Tax=Ralstonia sp. UBA689 TaxID=1947373 RepID=UPI0025F86FC1|nr:hypothetical protein [Ralstonia sp. UBA689]
MDTSELFYHATMQAMELRRIHNGQRLWDATGGVVQHGLLTGYYLGDRATWRTADNGAKLLGLYEQEVCDLIARIKGNRSTLVDLGAADGFYGVGLIATNHFQQSYCYEVVPESRENLKQIAEQAGVGDRVHIFGEATSNFTAELTAAGVQFSDAVVLCDIEGYEFQVLTRNCLADMKDAHIIIEVHDFCVVDGSGPQQLRELIERAGEFFHIHEYKAGARDLSSIPLIADHWNDNDRWLLCSEGRAKLMSWLHFEPKG